MTDDPNPVVIQKSPWLTIVTIASISGLFIIFIAALWVAGFFTFTGSDPSSKVVAAALAFVGGLVAAVVSIIGIVLKYSIDQRTETRLAIETTRAAAERKTESERANALQTQAEQRLSLEAAIRAVELLGTTEGNAAPLQQAGALYALSNLNQHRLTLDLVSYLLEIKSLESNIACSLMDRALKGNDKDAHRQAVELLYDRADQMLIPTGALLPDIIFYWDHALPATVRQWALYAVCKTLMARPLKVWQSDFDSDASGIVSVLSLAWESESDELYKNNAGAILRTVLEAFPDYELLYHPKKTINTIELRAKIANSEATSTMAEEIVRKLEVWKTATPQSANVSAAPVAGVATDKSDKAGVQLFYLSIAGK